MLTTLLLFVQLSYAQDCNPKTLKGSIAAATPQGVVAAYEAMAKCDPKMAQAEAANALAKAIPGEDGNAVARQAILVGANDAVRTYVVGLQSDDRAKAVASFGAACGKHPEVAAFLVESSEKLGDRFWKERWYRSLAECRVPEIQEMLRKEVQNPSSDRGRFFGVLEVFSRNLGKDAIPYLKTLLITLKEEEELAYVVNAFADAAQVGSLNGQDAEATALAVAALVEMAPQLPPKALDQARLTLTTLGSPQEADKLAIYRFAAVKHADGQLHYGVIVVETATCKKGDTQVRVHVGELVEPGQKWPDQVVPAAEAAANGAWTYELAKKCKGTSTNKVLISNEPLSAEALKTWQTEQTRAVQKASTDAAKFETWPEATPVKL